MVELVVVEEVVYLLYVLGFVIGDDFDLLMVVLVFGEEGEVVCYFDVDLFVWYYVFVGWVDFFVG